VTFTTRTCFWTIQSSGLGDGERIGLALATLTGEDGGTGLSGPCLARPIPWHAMCAGNEGGSARATKATRVVDTAAIDVLVGERNGGRSGYRRVDVEVTAKQGGGLDVHIQVPVSLRRPVMQFIAALGGDELASRVKATKVTDNASSPVRPPAPNQAAMVEVTSGRGP
jgi:hypothetical protein